MNNTIQLFANPEFGEIRTIKQADEIYFVGKDVAEILGYADTDKAIRNHVDEEDKLTRQFSGSGQARSMVTINESDLYSLVLSSKLPSAKRFKRWVTSEVLPALRRDGGYMVADANETPEELVARALRVAQQTIDRQKAQIDEMRPKALFRIKETAITHADGHVTLSRTPKVTGAGQKYFIKRFINGHLKELEPCK